MTLLTFLKTLLLSSYLFSIFFLSSCASTPPPYDGYSPISQIFTEDFEVVWRACQLSIQKYPIRVNNLDKGELETDWIQGYEIWSPPYSPSLKSGGMQYRLSMRTVKGKLKGDKAVKVSIQKFVEKKRDFFADVETPPSDGYEEKAILYRIDREIQIDRALQLAQEKENQ